MVGIFTAMDESVWEHLKLAFWPGMLWTGILTAMGRSNTPNFALARALAVAAPPVAIVVGFYGYTALLGRNFLALDIGLFLLAVALGQFVAISLYKKAPVSSGTIAASWVSMALLALAFSAASFLPIESSIFIDHNA